jgi:hypothetical protein
MRYLKLFEAFEDIHEICKKYNIKSYTINEDGSIDVKVFVDLRNKGLTKIPLKFRNVTGGFDCSYNQLTSLEDCPDSVGGSFSCSNNKLTSLEFCPTSVGGSLYCSENQLTSLEGCPTSVGGGLYCSSNKLTSLKGCSSVGDDFYCTKNKIVSFEGPRHIGGYFVCDDNPIEPIWYLISPSNKWVDMELFNDMDIIQDDVIILDRLNEFLESIGRQPVTEVEGWKCV